MLFFLGNLYYQHGDYENAFHYLIDATDRFDKIGYENLPLASWMASSLFWMYYRFEDYNTALRFLQIALAHPDPQQRQEFFCSMTWASPTSS